MQDCQLEKKEILQRVNTLRNDFFLWHLHQQHQGKSLGKIEKHYLEHYTKRDYDEFWAGYPRNLYRMSRGCSIRKNELIEVIISDLPFLGYIFDHPLWVILNNSQASLSGLYQYMKNLKPELVTRLFKTNADTHKEERKPLNFTSQVDSIIMMGDLDSLACLLMLTREAELQSRADLYIELKWAIRHSFSLNASSYPFIFFGDEVYQLCYQLFIGRNDPLPDHLNKPFLRMFKIHNCPSRKSRMYYSKDANATILWYAHLHQFILDNKKAEQRLLFFAVKLALREKLMDEFKSLPSKYIYDGNPYSLSPALRKLMERYTQDRRSDVSNRDFFD